MKTVRRLGPVFALLMILALFLAFLLSESQDPRTEEVPEAVSGGSILVIFSSPEDPASSTFRGGPDTALAEAIDAAQYSVDMAIYKLDLWSLRDALLDAHRRGVEVRIVVESSYVEEPEIEALISSGITVHDDQRDSLMHHKFTVIDRFEVWTGSMNYSINGAYRHDNNMIRIRSAEVGANYTREFEEMFLEDRFGGLSRADTPYPESLLDGDLVEVYFSPDDSVATRLVEKIDDAQNSIDMLAFAFTSDPLAESLLKAMKRGVFVRVVVEKDQAGNTGSEVDNLLEGGVDLRFDSNPNSMHHKVILIDGNTVITGSYNFSRSAEDFNDENVIIVHNAELTADYLVEFNRIFDRAEVESVGRDE
jgi:phosphatidylserine/phosphatidylglycerophosphate/cardiolipin synthase-like enzyme